MRITVTVDGVVHDLDVDPRTTLLDLLREELDLVGTKKGCDHGQCGACTVLVDNRRIVACLQLAATLEGPVTTVEGLAGADGALHPVQEAFLRHDAYQCGFCTPGQIMSAIGCIAEGRAGTADAVRDGMSGNLCRCSAYPEIVRAVLDARRVLEERR